MPYNWLNTLLLFVIAWAALDLRLAVGRLVTFAEARERREQRLS